MSSCWLVLDFAPAPRVDMLARAWVPDEYHQLGGRWHVRCRVKSKERPGMAWWRPGDLIWSRASKLATTRRVSRQYTGRLLYSGEPAWRDLPEEPYTG